MNYNSVLIYFSRKSNVNIIYKVVKTHFVRATKGENSGENLLHDDEDYNEIMNVTVPVTISAAVKELRHN